MIAKRLFAGLLAAALTAGTPAAYAAGQNTVPELGQTPAHIYFDMNAGGTITLRNRDADERIYETIISVEGEETLIRGQILSEDGTNPEQPEEVRREQNEGYTYCLETAQNREVELSVTPAEDQIVTVFDLIDADGHTESVKNQMTADKIFIQAGKTERVRVVFSDSREETAGMQDNPSESSGENETDPEGNAEKTEDQTPYASEGITEETDTRSAVTPAENTSPAADAGRLQESVNQERADAEQKRKHQSDNADQSDLLSGENLTKKDADGKLTDAVIEQYLLEHVDETYTKKDFLQVVNLMNGQQTLFSAAALPAGTSLDQAMTEDTYLDHWLGSYRFMIPVYWMSEDSDYYVAFLNTMQNDANAAVRDVVFAENNTDGHELDGCIYDAATGIAYIPARLYRAQGDEAYQIGTVQAQLLQAVSGSGDGTGEESTCEVLTSRDKKIETGTASEQMLGLSTTVQTEAGMNPSKMHVSVNGMPLTEDYYDYNGASGELTIGMSSAAIASVDITEEKTGLLEKIAGTVGARVVHAVTESNMPNVYSGLKLKLPAYVQKGMFLQGNVIDTMMSNGTDAYNEMSKSNEGAPNVYAYEYTHGHLDYAWDEKNSDGTFKHAAGELIDLIYNGERQDTVKGETITRKLKYSKLSQYTDAWWQVLNFGHADSKALNVYNANGKKTGDPKVNLSSLGNIPLTCSHITCPLGNISGGIQDPDEDDLDSGAVNLRVNVRVRVCERNEEEGYAVLGVLAAHHKVAAGEADNGQTGVAVFKVAIEPTTAKIKIRKQSASPEVSGQNGLYSLADAVYTIYKDAACTEKAGEFKTDASGESNTVTLQMGTPYWYKETTAPKGFYPDKEVHTFSLDGSETERVEIVSDRPKEAVPKMLVYKVDAETGQPKPQGDASLADAQFTVKHYGGTAASGNSLHTWVFRTDEKGCIEFDAAHLVSGTLIKNTAGQNTFPLGFYTFEETKTPEGYLPIGKTFSISLLENGEGVKWSDEGFVNAGFRAEEPVEHGGIQVTKQDIELNRAAAIAGGDLSGIRFEVVNVSKETVMYQGKPAAPNETVVILETDSNGNASTGEKTLPYGTYTVRELPADKREISANDSYLLSDSKAHTIEIRKDGEVKSEVFSDQIKRSGLEFRKIAEKDDKGLPCIPFVLEQKETGERHVILTDQNGRFSTEKYAHSLETNKLDALLGRDPEKTVIAAEELKDYEFGTWFGIAADGSAAPVNDKLKALPYGNYILNELRCEANQNYQLIQNYAFTIEEDGEYFDFNNLKNREEQIEIGTTLTDEGTGEHVSSIGEDEMIHLTDAVECRNLTVGETYILQAVLMDQMSEDLFRVENAEGNKTTVRGELQFRAEESSMTVSVPLAAFQTPEEALHVVAFEKLYAVTEDGKRGQVLASHEDISDGNQTVQIPVIHTEAADQKTGTHTGTSEENQIITDTVTYSNLTPGQQYVVRGTLIDKTTGEVLKEGENPVTGETAFSPQEKDGSIGVDFQVDSRELPGKTIVVFEELFRLPEEDGRDGKKEILTAIHKNPEDQAQFVIYPDPEKPEEPEEEPKEKKPKKLKPQTITPAPSTEPEKPEKKQTASVRKKLSPGTGDTSRPLLFGGIFGGAALGIGVLIHIILHRKRR